MTNFQFLLSVGIPSLLIILNSVSDYRRLCRIERRLESWSDPAGKLEQLGRSMREDTRKILAAIHAADKVR